MSYFAQQRWQHCSAVQLLHINVCSNELYNRTQTCTVQFAIWLLHLFVLLQTVPLQTMLVIVSVELNDLSLENTESHSHTSSQSWEIKLLICFLGQAFKKTVIATLIGKMGQVITKGNEVKWMIRDPSDLAWLWTHSINVWDKTPTALILTPPSPRLILSSYRGY